MIDLEGIVSISGKPGLYRLLTTSSKGLIVESVESGKRLPADPHNSINTLDEIMIHTEEGETPLGELFQRIYDAESGGSTIDHRSSKEELQAKFEEVLPEYDKENVYPSDIKKCFQWYNLLQGVGALKFKEEEKDGQKAEKNEDQGEANDEEHKDEEGRNDPASS
ncbi:MAG: DUF5606 domain-containing protein [Flavobacteriales bacterium]